MSLGLKINSDSSYGCLLAIPISKESVSLKWYSFVDF